MNKYDFFSRDCRPAEGTERALCESLLPCHSKALAAFFAAFLLMLLAAAPLRAAAPEKASVEMPEAAVGSGEAPAIRFDKESVNLGKVSQGESVEHVFTVYNDGTAPLVINKVVPS